MKKIFPLPIIFFIIVSVISCKGDDDNATLPKSDAKQITGFVFSATDNTALESNITATINETDKTISAAVPYGTDVTALVPEITISDKASVNPTGEQDFSTQVDYIVTAEDGSKATYEATVSITPNDEKQILSFQFFATDNDELTEDIIAVIDEENKTISAEVPYGTDVTALTPEITISAKASVSPVGVQDFSSEVDYIVTADNESTEIYTVILEILDQRDILITIYEANPGNTLSWPIDEDDISTWEGVATDGDGNIIHLNIFNKDITTLPKEIGHLTNLIELSLGQNQITTLPVEIGNLTNLTKLDLYNNQLTSILTEIGNLNQLTILYIGQNQLTTLPAQIGNLTQLTRLDISQNQLTTLPAQIGNLTQLTRLDIGQNQITTLPVEIGNLNQLTILYIGYNPLTTLPAQIGNLTQLTRLDIGQSQLTTLPAEIGNLTNLTHLWLSDNQLTTIPAEIGQLTSINTIYLSSNQLTSIPGEIGNLNSLRYLFLSSNQLTSIPGEIGNLNNLNILSLLENLLTSIPQEVCDLETLYGTILLLNAGVTCE